MLLLLQFFFLQLCLLLPSSAVAPPHFHPPLSIVFPLFGGLCRPSPSSTGGRVQCGTSSPSPAVLRCAQPPSLPSSPLPAHTHTHSNPHACQHHPGHTRLNPFLLHTQASFVSELGAVRASVAPRSNPVCSTRAACRKPARPTDMRIPAIAVVPIVDAVASGAARRRGQADVPPPRQPGESWAERKRNHRGVGPGRLRPYLRRRSRPAFVQKEGQRFNWWARVCNQTRLIRSFLGGPGRTGCLSLAHTFRLFVHRLEGPRGWWHLIVNQAQCR